MNEKRRPRTTLNPIRRLVVGALAFIPHRVIFERDALNYPLGRTLFERFRAEGVEIGYTGSHNRVTTIPGRTPQQAYAEGKRTLVVGVRRTLDFQTCKPSAHYQLPLATSCPGKCEYCYLLTSLPAKPYLRVYVNVEEILDRAREYIEEREPQVTSFEGAATSDPVPVEQFTGALARTIEFFAEQQSGRFRFVTKFAEIDSLLGIEHRGHTTIRFSVNTPEIIKTFEHGTAPLALRLEAARKAARAGYPVGFMIAPIILEAEGGLEAYRQLLTRIRTEFGEGRQLSFELITHRFTARAVKRMREVFPHTTLPLGKENRRFKYGQFGYGKYVYTPELMTQLRDFLVNQTRTLFPNAEINYLV